MTDEKDDPGNRLREIVKGFDTAMLATYTDDRELHARPMAVAEVGPEDVLYFATSLDSAKVSEVMADPKGYAIFQDGSRYAALTGAVRILRDRGLVDRLWSETWRLWFPKGKDDPSLCILAFDVEEGEYWDRGGANALKFFFKAAKAYATGTQPVLDATEHGKARLG